MGKVKGKRKSARKQSKVRTKAPLPESTNSKKPKKQGQGRPAKNIVKPIKNTPEQVARAIMQNAPKKNWRYLRQES